MNPFASRTQKTIDIPFDLPNTVTIRKLAGRHLGRANQEFLNTLIAAVHARGGAKVQKDLEELFAKDPKKAANDIGEVKADPLNGYDKYFICAKGIVAWTYAESLSPIPPFDMKAVLEMARRGDIEQAIEVVTTIPLHRPWAVPAIDDLDDDALTFFATEIMRLTKPSLFETVDEQEADRKNG